MAREKVLDEGKKREIVALATAGMSLAKIARYVGCGRKTIFRERQSDEEFDFRMRRAWMARDLNPREAMRRFASTHWRAAAWMLEREERQEKDRRNTAANHFTRDDLDTLCLRVKQLVHSGSIIELGQGTPLIDQIDEVFREATPAARRMSPVGPRPGPTIEESMKFLKQAWSRRAAAAKKLQASDGVEAESPNDPTGSLQMVAGCRQNTPNTEKAGQNARLGRNFK